MCEFLAHSKELIISFVTYQISAFKFSLHHLHNRQSITSETTDCLLIPLALVSNHTGTFFISLLTALRYVDFKSAGKRGFGSVALPQVLDSCGRVRRYREATKSNRSTFGQRDLMDRETRRQTLS